jgi:hypothetical protein
MVEVVRLQDVALRRRAAAGVLGQVDVGEADLPEVSAAFLLLKNKTDEKDVSFFAIRLIFDGLQSDGNLLYGFELITFHIELH